MRSQGFFCLAEKRRLSRSFAACTSKTLSPPFAWCLPAVRGDVAFGDKGDGRSQRRSSGSCFLTRVASLLLPPAAEGNAPSRAGETGAFVRVSSNIKMKHTFRCAFLAEKRRLSRCFVACTSKTLSPVFAWCLPAVWVDVAFGDKGDGRSQRRSPGSCFLTRIFSLLLPPAAGENAPSRAGETVAVVLVSSNIKMKHTFRCAFWRRRGDFRAASQLAPRKHCRRSSLGALARLLFSHSHFLPSSATGSGRKCSLPRRGNRRSRSRILQHKNEAHLSVCFLAEKRRLSRGFAACTSKTWVAFLRLGCSERSLFSHSHFLPFSAAGSGRICSLPRRGNRRTRSSLPEHKK